MALVRPQVSEAASTLLATVRGGAAVDPLVGVQVPQLLEASAALRASVGALARVHALVPLQAGEHGEALPALRTGEGALGAGVPQPVALESGGVSEPLPALRTDERLLARVDALVLPQVAQVVKVAPAVRALVTPVGFHLPRPADADASAEARADGCPRATQVLHAHAPSRVGAALAQGGHGRGGGLKGLQGLGAGRVCVHQSKVLLQEQGVGTEGLTQGADVGVAGELLTWKTGDREMAAF